MLICLCISYKHLYIYKNKNKTMNPDIIKIEVIKIYDRRNKELSNFNLVSLYGGEPQLITKEEHEAIDDKNRVMRNEDLAFAQYLSKWS